VMHAGIERIASRLDLSTMLRTVIARHRLISP
jgi:hypothetical protein